MIRLAYPQSPSIFNGMSLSRPPPVITTPDRGVHIQTSSPRHMAWDSKRNPSTTYSKGYRLSSLGPLCSLLVCYDFTFRRTPRLAFRNFRETARGFFEGGVKHVTDPTPQVQTQTRLTPSRYCAYPCASLLAIFSLVAISS